MKIEVEITEDELLGLPRMDLGESPQEMDGRLWAIAADPKLLLEMFKQGKRPPIAYLIEYCAYTPKNIKWILRQATVVRAHRVDLRI